MKLKVIEEIGPGGFGMVEKVKDEKGNIYARKTFVINNATFPKSLEKNAKERFKREAKYQSSINHKNIVQVLHADLDANPPFYLMPLAISSLATDIENDRTLNGQFLECMMDIIAGLEELHSMRIYHRDLKPANVLKFSETKKKTYYAIGDFGLIAISQTRVATLTQTGMRMGSDYYTAPEIVGDLKQASIQSDIFSLGCILHDFIGDSHRIPNYEINERGPYSAIMRGCTRKDRKRRFKSVAAVRDALLSLGDIKSTPQTAEGNTILELISNKIHPTEKEWEKIIDFIDDKFDSEDSLNVIRKITLEHIDNISSISPTLLGRLGTIYARWIRDRAFIFAECDGLAIRLGVFIEECEIDVQAECLMAMLYMGSRHNRWYVEEKFVSLISKSMNDDLAKRLAVDIRVDDEKACKAFDHLKGSIKYDEKNSHPLLVKALKDIC
jgi:serine/threonine protein kinase